MSSLLVVADDATGALEAGAILAGCGYPAEVRLEAESLCPEQRACVVLLPTRHDTAPAAQQRVERALSELSSHPGADVLRLYWKTDSTLRGPIGACFAALRKCFPRRPLVYVPAYPDMGRIVHHGILFVDGIPVAETAFALDLRTPVQDSRVATAAGAALGLRISLVSGERELTEQLHRFCLPRDGSDVIICEAQTSEQVAAFITACNNAERAGPCAPVIAGPAGGIRSWVVPHRPVFDQGSPLPPIGRWLVLCGSRHPVSRAQAAAAREAGLEVLAMPETPLDNPEIELQRIAGRALATNADGILIFGGDTALALWRTMGLRSIEALGECMPGVAVSHAQGITFVTKAGGFGSTQLAVEVITRSQTAIGDA